MLTVNRIQKTIKLPKRNFLPKQLTSKTRYLFVQKSPPQTLDGTFNLF